MRWQDRSNTHRRRKTAMALLAIASTSLTADDPSAQPPAPSPGAKINYHQWLDTANPPPPGQNAAVEYLKAASLPELKLQENLPDNTIRGPWRGLPQVTHWIEQAEPAFEHFRRGARMEYVSLGLRPATNAPRGRLWKDTLIHATIPGLGAFDPICKGLLAQGWRAWDEGREQPLIDNTLVTLAIARQLERERPLATRMTAITIAIRSYQSLLRALALSPNRTALARTIETRLEPIDPPLRSLSDTYEFQRLSCWDILQRAYATDETGTVVVTPSTAALYESLVRRVTGPAAPWNDAHATMRTLGFQASLTEANRYFDQLADLSQASYQDVPSQAIQMETRGRSLANPLTRAFVQDLTIPTRAHGQALTMQRGLRRVITILTHVSTHQTLPESLTEMDATQRHQRPTIDPYSGRDFVYTRTRSGFVLYSMGPDGKDDAGRPYLPGTQAGDIVIWPPR